MSSIPTSPFPDRIFAQASPKSTGQSMFAADASINAMTSTMFTSPENLVQDAVGQLRQAGFEVLHYTDTMINIAGSRELYEAAFKCKLESAERPVIKEGAVSDTATFFDCPTTNMQGLIDTNGTPFADALEGVAIEEPRYYMSATPPSVNYWHLDVPHDVAKGCNADGAHTAGFTGKGIRVAMVDSGHFLHPFFTSRGYRCNPAVLGPGATNHLHDENGHGTGESANIFAIAPDAELLPVKMNFANSIGAFNAAVALEPRIITCSWGSDNRFGPLSAADRALAVAIATAVSRGIVVVFSAGNGHWGFPGQHPDVISAGGTFLRQDGKLQASDYSSGFDSNIFAGRRVPDLTGLVGMLPKAIYIMLPIESGCAIDTNLSGASHPNKDETTSTDSWAAFSGTSAAAPQLAGAAAVLLEADPKMTPSQVRSTLQRTARDIQSGTCNPNTGANPALVGPDNATGHGLVDVNAAVQLLVPAKTKKKVVAAAR